jgi:hypothetical protein
VPAQQWGDIVDLGWMKIPQAGAAGLLASHWSYHCGQVAYIQRLYGDAEM